ncbi:MAG: TolC family protein [Chthoniobacterales bacterium]
MIFSRDIALIFAAAGMLSGCAGNPKSAFDGVEKSVARASGKQVHWLRSGQEQADAQRAVQAMLRRPLNADSAAQIALLNNKSLQSRFEQLGIGFADYVEASLPSNPSFAASVRFPSKPPSGTNIEYSIAQDLLSLLLLPIKRNLAARELEITRLQIAGDVLGLVAETKAAFYTLQARQQLLGRLQLIVQTNEAGADLAKGQHDAGNITDLDLANQQALYSQSRVEVGQTQAEIRSDRERLNRLLGAWGAQTNWTVAGELPAIPSSEISLARLESKAIAQRVDLAAVRQEVASLGLAMSLKQKTRFVPGGVNVGVDTERDPDRQRVTGPTLDLQLPIFNFGQAALLRLRSQLAQAQRDLEAMSVNARSEVREARDLIAANRELAAYYRKVLLPQRLLIVNQTQLQYNAMQLGPIDLLTAKERELNAERTYIDTWRDYWIARTELERAMHGGSGGGMQSMQRETKMRSMQMRGGESRMNTSSSSN